MKKIELFIIPYAKENGIKTRLFVDGNRIDSKDNRLTNLVVYQPMRKWLNPYKRKLFVWNGLLPEIIEEFNDRSVQFIFHGCKADYILFKKSILVQQMKLNRNGGIVDVAFELIDKWDPKKATKALSESLDDMRVEADNWGEDDIIKEIDSLKSAVCNCKVKLKSEYCSSAELQSLLQNNHIDTESEAALTVIPVDGSISISGICDFITALFSENNTDRKYVVVNTSKQEYDELLDSIISFDNGSDISIKYIENDEENYIKEIEKIYYQSTLPDLIQNANRILHMFPDCDTNSFLIDISDRIDDLISIRL